MTINEKIESKLLTESEKKIEELKPQYGWMNYAYDKDKYKASDIYKKKKLIVAWLKKISEQYSNGEEKDLYKSFWDMILDVQLSHQFWIWLDYNLDKFYLHNSNFDDKDITPKFLWNRIILGKDGIQSNDENPELVETKKEKENEQD